MRIRTASMRMRLMVGANNDNHSLCLSPNTPHKVVGLVDHYLPPSITNSRKHTKTEYAFKASTPTHPLVSPGPGMSVAGG